MGHAVADVYRRVFDRFPRWLRSRLYPVDEGVRRWVEEAASRAAPGAWVLDAGAGEGRFRSVFGRCRYIALDAGVGDDTWDYSGLDVQGRLERLPLADGAVDVVIHTQVLEHVARPEEVLFELSRVLRPGGALYLTAPQGWPEHQAPRDYFRFTRFALDRLLREAGFEVVEISPLGGYFHYLGHRLSYLPKILFHTAPTWRRILLFPLELLFMAVFCFVVPLACFYLDRLDSRREFTLSYRAEARKRTGEERKTERAG